MNSQTVAENNEPTLFDLDNVETRKPKVLAKKPTITIPGWLLDGKEISAQVYYSMQDKFAEDSLKYLEALISLGGCATDHEIKEYFNDIEKWPLHIVAARRNYFTKAPFDIVRTYPGQTIMGPKGKPNTLWFINFKNLYHLVA